MGKIHLVSSCGVSRKVVHKILCSDHQTVAVAFKQVVNETPGELTLMTLATWDGHVYVFDIKRCKDLMTDGEIWRILLSEETTKVMHDCRHTSAALKSQFGITMRNVFDTQAAYCMVMMLRSLPPRFIHVHHLYEKFGDSNEMLLTEIQENISGSGIFWAQRPLSDAMMRSAATEAQILVPVVYENLKRELSPAHDTLLSDLCYAYIHGRFRNKNKTSPDRSATARNHRPILRLSESQQYLLENTIPQSAGTLTYGKS